MSLSRFKKIYTRNNFLKTFMGRFSVICPFFRPVKLIVYTSSHLNNKTDKSHKCSKSEITGGSLAKGGSKQFAQSKGEYPSRIRLFFTIAENSYNIDVCEMIHNLTKNGFFSTECSVCMSFNNVSPISVIDLHQILKIKEYKNRDLVYNDLDLCGWCVMKCQNMNTHKIIHTCLYDMQQIQKEEYVNVNVVWVPLCTDVQRQILYIDTFTDNSFFAVKVLILLRRKKYMKHYSIIL